VCFSPSAIKASQATVDISSPLKLVKNMPAKITVMKFGGTSLEDRLAFERVARIVSSHKRESLVIVVSAMSLVTEALLLSLRAAAKGKISVALRSIDEHLERHLQVTHVLRATSRAGITRLIESFRQEIAELLEAVALSGKTSASLEDSIASYGERLSAHLLTVVLEEHGVPASYVDARQCILTDEEHGKARPLLKETWQRTRAELEPLLKAKRVPVLGGFIAATQKGVTTTMGRGSSDYTATLVSAALGARETQIWTDVNGVLTADPRLIKSARTVPQLSYGEAEELARFGVKVLHSKTIQPAAEHEIPVRICNSRAPEEIGTLICARTEAATSTVKAISHKSGVMMVEITSTPALVANGFLPAIRKIFDRHQTALDIIATSDIGVSLMCEETNALPLIIQDLQQVGSTELKRDRAIICCVGEGLQSVPSYVMKLFDTLTNIDFTWRSASASNFLLVVDEEHAAIVIRRLHHAIFEQNQDGREQASGNGKKLQLKDWRDCSFMIRGLGNDFDKYGR
jgi:aspartate kinase